MTQFLVFLTDDAARDLEELYDYLTRNEVPGRADHVLDKIENSLISLSESPHRGVLLLDESKAISCRKRSRTI